MRYKIGIIMFVALLVGGMVGVACGGDEEAAPAAATPAAEVAATTAPAPAPTEKGPEKGGILNFTQSYQIGGFDPKPSSWMTRGGHSLYQTFTIVDPTTFELHPELAKSWEWSDDFMKLTLKLQEGVSFHNGEPWNADAAVWNIHQWLRDDVRVVFQAPDLAMKKATAIDDMTVEIEMNYPYTGIVRFFDMITPNGLIPPIAGATEEFMASPAGIGPFKFVEWTKGVSYELTRNDDYWRDGIPLLDGMKIWMVEDENVRLVGMLTGQFDMIERVPGSQIGRLEGRDDVTISTKLSNGYGMQRTLNSHCAPFDNKHARRAVAYAFPKKAILNNLQYGLGFVSKDHVSPPWGPYHDPDYAGITYDLDKAREELKLAGTPDGFSFDVVTFHLPSHIQANEMIQSELKKIGITMNFKANVDFIGYFGSTRQPGWDAEPNCGFNMAGLWHGGFQDLYYLFSTAAGGPRINANAQQGNTPEMDDLLVKFRAMPLDSAEMIATAKEINVHLTEEAWNIGIYHVNNMVAWREYVHGFVPSLMDHEYFFYDAAGNNTWMSSK